MNKILSIFTVILLLAFVQGCNLIKPDNYLEVYKIKEDKGTRERKIEDKNSIKKYEQFFKNLDKKEYVVTKFNEDYQVIHMFKKKSLSKHHVEIDIENKLIKADNKIYNLSTSEYDELLKLLKINKWKLYLTWETP